MIGFSENQCAVIYIPCTTRELQRLIELHRLFGCERCNAKYTNHLWEILLELTTWSHSRSGLRMCLSESKNSHEI